jgi:hypothetical protein
VDGLNVALQTGAAAGCETVTVCPATKTGPVRAAPLFGATLSVTLPLPVPFAPLAI